VAHAGFSYIPVETDGGKEISEENTARPIFGSRLERQTYQTCIVQSLLRSGLEVTNGKINNLCL
jgi:hypothetical protein